MPTPDWIRQHNNPYGNTGTYRYERLVADEEARKNLTGSNRHDNLSDKGVKDESGSKSDERIHEADRDDAGGAVGGAGDECATGEPLDNGEA
jgi:hypothetical protein